MKVIERKKQVWPQIKITGGPHGKNTQIEIDGEPMKGLQRAEITLDAQDVVHATLFRVAEAYIDVEGEVEELQRVKVYSTVVDVDQDSMKRRLVITGTGATLAEALRAAAVEAEALG